MRRIVLVAIPLILVLLVVVVVVVQKFMGPPEPSAQPSFETLLVQHSVSLQSMVVNASLVILPVEMASSLLGAQDNPVTLGKPILLTSGDAQEYVAIAEVNRGDEAWHRIQRYSAQNGPASEGKEYLMALVVVRYVRGAKEQAALNFQALSNDTTSHDAVNIVHVRPDFLIDFTPDTMSGGWIVREVEPGDPAPLLAVRLGSDANSPNVAYFATGESY